MLYGTSTLGILPKQFGQTKVEEFAGIVAQVEGLRGRMSEAERQVEELFDALLSQSFEAT